jgi:hypothetical protein
VGRDLDALVEGIQPFLSMRPPELCETALDGVVCIFIAITEPLLKVRDAKDPLEGRVDPAGSVPVAKAEHSISCQERPL